MTEYLLSSINQALSHIFNHGDGSGMVSGAIPPWGLLQAATHQAQPSGRPRQCVS